MLDASLRLEDGRWWTEKLGCLEGCESCFFFATQSRQYARRIATVRALVLFHLSASDRRTEPFFLVQAAALVARARNKSMSQCPVRPFQLGPPLRRKSKLEGLQEACACRDTKSKTLSKLRMELH